MNPKTKNLTIRTISGVVYVSLMILAVYNSFIALLVGAFLGVVGIFEFVNMSDNILPNFKNRLPLLLMAEMGLAFMALRSEIYLDILLKNNELGNFVGFSSNHGWIFFVWIVVFMLAIFLPSMIENDDYAISKTSFSLLSQFWIVLPLIVLFIFWIPRNPAQVLAFFIIIWAADTFAYLGGSLFGKHKLAKSISPSKTWEGFIISTLLTVALSIGLSFIPYFHNAEMQIWKWILFAVFIEIFGLLGDLCESMFKRKAGVKDSGKIIPGHGGVLDRIDSILFATIPMFFFCM